MLAVEVAGLLLHQVDKTHLLEMVVLVVVDEVAHNHKERLVQLKTLLSQHRDSLEQAYASDDARRIQIYTDLVTQLSDKIPKAESALREGHLAFETQREEVRRIRDEIASVRATGMLSDTLDIESDFQKRAALIRDLTESLRTKLRRAQALLEVNRTQETFPKP